jgi:hypothetical protein
MKQAFNIPSLPQSVKARLAVGAITLKEAAEELSAANFLPFVDEDEATKFLAKF